MPTYNCELCGKEFNQKGDFTKHKSKKTPCITMEQIKEIQKKVDVENITTWEKFIEILGESCQTMQTNISNFIQNFLQNPDMSNNLSYYDASGNLIQMTIDDEFDYDLSVD